MTGNCGAIHRVIQLFGSQNGLARALGRRQSTIWGWSSSGRIPSQRIPEVIDAAARLEPPVHLRPDDFFDIPTAASIDRVSVRPGLNS